MNYQQHLHPPNNDQIQREAYQQQQHDIVSEYSMGSGGNHSNSNNSDGHLSYNSAGDMLN